MRELRAGLGVACHRHDTAVTENLLRVQGKLGDGGLVARIHGLPLTPGPVEIRTAVRRVVFMVQAPQPVLGARLAPPEMFGELMDIGGRKRPMPMQDLERQNVRLGWRDPLTGALPFMAEAA